MIIIGNLLKTLAYLTQTVITIYILIIIIRSILSWAGPLPRHPAITILRRLTDPVFLWVHRHLPFTIIGGIDISPIIIVTALIFIQQFVTGVLLGYAYELLRPGG